MDKYEIVKQLGKGAQGAVYKAIRNSDNKTVALKVITAYPETNVYKNAIKEIELLEKIATPNCHPNVACYYGHHYDRKDGKIYIEMEFIEGEDLFEFSKKYRDKDHPLSNYVLYKYLLLITKDIIKGLLYIHDKGILHNDIKPENIMIDRDLVPKLIDFGLGCSANDVCYLDNNGPKQMVRCCSGFAGTPDYASPEMYRHEERYAASDVWSLGVSLYTSALGKYPFNYGADNPTVRDIMQAILYKDPEKLETNNELLNYIVNNSIIKNPGDRITTEEINDALYSYK